MYQVLKDLAHVKAALEQYTKTRATTTITATALAIAPAKKISTSTTTMQTTNPVGQSRRFNSNKQKHLMKKEDASRARKQGIRQVNIRIYKS